MKKRYQIDKQRAVQKFRQFAAEENQPIQLVIPLKEVLDLIQRGLMNVAMAAFTKRDGTRSDGIGGREEPSQRGADEQSLGQ